MIVVDASAVLSLLVDPGERGESARAQFVGHDLAYPSNMPFEVANALRRLEHRQLLERSEARRALRHLDSLHGQEYPFADVSARVWELRANLTAYDAAYVALAELIARPLLTFDERLRAAPGVRCQFIDS
ncbi:MAG: type II toxin-antitoxin system VapC family toxin [Actinomycetota bacterium]|jgi:predicted nucleic acid-binding protein